jgi:hypothetical protein
VFSATQPSLDRRPKNCPLSPAPSDPQRPKHGHTHASDHSPSHRWSACRSRPMLTHQSSRQLSRSDNPIERRPRNRSSRTGLGCTRPEAYQNLIHISKDQRSLHRGEPQWQPPHRRGQTSRTLCPDPSPHRTRTSAILFDHPARDPAHASCAHASCAHASYPARPLPHPRPAVGPGLETTGIEPVTPCLQSRCSPS